MNFREEIEDFLTENLLFEHNTEETRIYVASKLYMYLQREWGMDANILITEGEGPYDVDVRVTDKAAEDEEYNFTIKTQKVENENNGRY